jgi:hypothetical protein
VIRYKDIRREKLYKLVNALLAEKPDADAARSSNRADLVSSSS